MIYDVAVWFGWLVGCLLLIGVIGVLYQQLAQRSDRTPPAGELGNVSGRNMHLVCRGESFGPTIILEAGGSSSSITSRGLQAKLAEYARVCSYDRAGYGFSDPLTENRTFDEITQDLDQLLTDAQVPPPYILVGESMGGLMVRNYYRHHPDNVAGVVLLDAAEEQHTFSRIDKLKSMRSAASATAWLARFGVVRVLLTTLPGKFGLPNNLRPKLRKAIIAEYSRPGFYESAVRELGAYFSTPVEKTKAGGFGSLGSTPLTVITHGIPFSGSQQFLEDGWQDAQNRLSSLSSKGKLLVAEHSGHAISLDQPELVVAQIREMLAAVASEDKTP